MAEKNLKPLHYIGRAGLLVWPPPQSDKFVFSLYSTYVVRYSLHSAKIENIIITNYHILYRTTHLQPQKQQTTDHERRGDRDGLCAALLPGI